MEPFNRMMTEKMKLTQWNYDECIYTNAYCIVLVYIGDVLLVGKRQETRENGSRMSKFFQMTTTEVNQLVDFLGCRIFIDQQCLFVLEQAT